MTTQQLREFAERIAKASPHDHGIAKLLAVIDQYYPEPPPAITSWAAFDDFWARWWPNGLLEVNAGRMFGSAPNAIPQGDDAAMVKLAFLGAMDSFLTDLRENRLETLNQLSEHQWALEQPPKRGLLAKLFGV